MERIAIIGGAGYIGSHTAVELIGRGYEVEILDNLSNSKITVLDNIEKITGVKPKFHKVDLLDLPAIEEVFKEGKFDLVMHFAGLKAVGESVEKALEYYENNVSGTINLLKCMKNNGVKKIIFSSSATVYGGLSGSKYVETMEAGRGLTSPYSKTKYMIEEILKDCAATDPMLRVVLLRYFNPIGNHPSGFLGEDPNGIPNNLMPIIMKVARGEIKELSIYGDDYPTPDGTCLRDYIHVMDLAGGHVAVMDKMDPGVLIYNLGSGKMTSVLEMVKAFEKVSGDKLPYKIVKRRSGDLAEFCADSSKAKDELGWEAKLTVDDAIKDTLKFLNKS